MFNHIKADNNSIWSNGISLLSQNDLKELLQFNKFLLTKTSIVSSLSPREIVSELDRYVVGQNNAKRAVAIALRNRWRRQALKGDMKDEVLPHSKESLIKFSQEYEIHFLTARPYNDAYNITKDWLDEKGFDYKSIIVVKQSMDKLKYVIEPECLFIDDLSRKHEIYDSYKILYWDVISELNKNNVKFI